MSTITLTPEHGYAMASALSYVIVLVWMSIKVGGARKKFGCKYPDMYMTGKDAKANLFNCHQRAHQNSLETFPTFIVVLFLASLYFPLYAAACGFVFSIGRVFYALGYYTGDPQKRYRGAWNMFGLLGLLLLSFGSVYKVVSA